MSSVIWTFNAIYDSVRTLQYYTASYSFVLLINQIRSIYWDNTQCNEHCKKIILQ